GEVDGVDERDEHADEAGAPGREAAGTAIRCVPLVTDHLRDELARLGRDVAAAVEHPRDGRDRDAGNLRDLADRHPRGAVDTRRLRHWFIEARSGTFRKPRPPWREELFPSCLDFRCPNVVNTFRNRLRALDESAKCARHWAKKGQPCDAAS